MAIKHIFPALPANAGVMRPIEVKIPEGSLLAAEFPAPVGGYTETILRMIDVIFAAMSQAAPDRVVANAYGTINALSIAGRRKTGQPWVMFSFYGGGHGGGLGAVYEIEVLEENGAEAFLFGERGRFAPQGVAGGGASVTNRFSYQQDDGWHEPPMASKMRGIALKQGQAVRLETPGGGYGPAAGRDPARVARDVAQGVLSPDKASELCGTAWKGVTA